MEQQFEDFLPVIKRKKRVWFNIPKSENKCAVVLAPHADDEVMGCGGTLYQLIEKGYRVYVLLFTTEYNSSIDRVKEFKKVKRKLDYEKMYLFNKPDGRLLQYIDDIKEQLISILKSLSPHLIFTPYLLDCVDDHKAVNKILYIALSEEIFKQSQFKIMMYEVWGLIPYPDYYIDISRIYSIKELLLSYYDSQEKKYGIKSKTKKINSIRAELSFRRNVKYIECFKSLNQIEFNKSASLLNKNKWFYTEK